MFSIPLTDPLPLELPVPSTLSKLDFASDRACDLGGGGGGEGGGVGAEVELVEGRLNQDGI